jgi:DNA primase catalytic subunit
MNFFISYLYLKVPKSETFNRSDFQDFFTINPFLEDDFGVKILTCYFGGARHHLISDAHA